MYIIVGLGNPTKEYDRTRHSMGSSMIDMLADRIGIDVSEKKHRALCGKGMLEGQKMILTKPQAFMNLSGESARAMVDFYEVSPDEVIIICDDVSLKPGQLRIHTKDGASGHNGVKNIIAHLGTQEFPRIEVDVGEKPKYMDLVDYVLSRFSKGEQELMDDTSREAADAVAMMIPGGMDAATNRFNTKKTRG